MSLRPVGNLPASVYWRRRLLVLVPLLFLVGLTLYVACSPGGSSPVAARTTPSAATPPSPTAAATSPAPTTSASAGSATAARPPTSPTATAPAAVAACPATALTVAAATSAPSYLAGSEPVLYLQVTNIGTTPCSQDIADPLVELRVFNGSTRVWGSHDCKIEPGTNVQTLAPGQPVRLSITWTGLASQPGCGGQRTRVPAGSYTLYALLAGTQGTPAQFTLG